jgi:hypothetical protein
MVTGVYDAAGAASGVAVATGVGDSAVGVTSLPQAIIAKITGIATKYRNTFLNGTFYSTP